MKKSLSIIIISVAILIIGIALFMIGGVLVGWDVLGWFTSSQALFIYFALLLTGMLMLYVIYKGNKK